MSYEDMSKSDLCISVARKWFNDVIQHGVNDDGSVYLDRASCKELVNFDPIKNHDDAYPIMEKYGMIISVDGSATIPKSKSDTGERISNHCKGQLLKSAMICFLKMKDAQQ